MADKTLGQRFKEQPQWLQIVEVGALLYGVAQLVKVAKQPKKVKCDESKTQVCKIPVWNLPTSDPDFEPYSTANLNTFVVRQCSWSPAELAGQLHAKMSDVNVTGGRAGVWNRLGNLNNEQIKCLHNYWIEKVDKKKSIGQWIMDQWPSLLDSDESSAKDYALMRLTQAGVGKE